MTIKEFKAVPWDVPIGTIVRVIDKKSCDNFNAIGLHHGQLGQVTANKTSATCAKAAPARGEYIRVNFGLRQWYILIKDIELVTQEELKQLGTLNWGA